MLRSELERPSAGRSPLSCLAAAAHPAWLHSAAMKTYVATPLDRERNWLLVDAEGQTLGRLATQIADALRGMLPKNRLARKQLTKLKVYAGPEHPHEAQKPQKLEITTR